MNFLLGKGERLAKDIVIKGGGGEKVAPYTFAQAITRLTPLLSNVVTQLTALPDDTFPDDQAVASITINPEYIAKSYFPKELLKLVGLEPVGSKPRSVVPEQRSKARDPLEALTTELFVMGPRSAFREMKERMPDWTEKTRGAMDLVKVEDFSVPQIANKLKMPISANTENEVFEVVLHTGEAYGENYVLSKFQSYLKGRGISAKLDKRFYAGGLCFLELEAPENKASDIAAFSIVRAIRKMPQLRMLRPTVRTSLMPAQSIVLPNLAPVDLGTRVAIFDGGIPADHPLTTWANAIETTGLGAESGELNDHGVAVTSAFLFGHIDPTKPLPQPYCGVDHYRVLDDEPGVDPHELYEVLERIQDVLKAKSYEFINLSLGPCVPIDDDDVHAWTAVIDSYLCSGEALVTVAIGNNGEGDALSGANRVLVPSDCVNALSVGACDSPDANWARASYSAVGPGRSPGLVKPDLVEFGGSMQRPFLVVDALAGNKLEPISGTSFAAPSTLRLGAGVRAHFGESLNALTIKTLLIHTSSSSDHPRAETGWGRLARTLEEVVTCDDNTVRVVYQGLISPSKYIRVPVSVPMESMTGNIDITTTLCYATDVDPHHPGNYTRAGLEICFRPHDQKMKDAKQQHADTAPFFSKNTRGLSEEERRRDAWKWENCQHAEVRKRANSLSNPVFDIHYNARSAGHGDAPPNDLRYSLVITVKAANVPDLYNRVVRRYSTQLEQLRPVISIPIRV